QVIAALAVAAAPVYQAFAGVLTMNSFEPLFWIGCAYLAMQIAQRGAESMWVPTGVLVGFGLLNKHSMGFFLAGLVAGLFISPQRRILFSRWTVIGALAALAIVLPHVRWQIAHGWPTIEL